MPRLDRMLSPVGFSRACRCAVALAGLAMLAGCNAKPTDDKTPALDDGTPVVQEVRAERPGLPERVPQAKAPAPTVGDLPEALLTRIRADLAARTGLDPGVFVLVRAESVTWNDGSLGCPRPDEYYSQAPVEGFWVVLSHLGQEYDYRVGTNGEFRLCTAPSQGLPQDPGRLKSPAARAEQ